MRLPIVRQDKTPKGKRTVKLNIYGNLVGYVGGKRWQEFGVSNSSNHRQAGAWKNGDPDWRNA